MSKSEFEVWPRQAEGLRDAALKEYAQTRDEEEKQRIVQEVRKNLNRR